MTNPQTTIDPDYHRMICPYCRIETDVVTDSHTNTRGRVIRERSVTRAMVRANTEKMYVFGDNMEGRGLGGQAREMRGEPNTVGVPTKWSPERRETAYFTDEDRLNRDVWHAINHAFVEMRAALNNGRDVVIPAYGLGTGLAELPTRAPKLFAMIQAGIASLESVDV